MSSCTRYLFLHVTLSTDLICLHCCAAVLTSDRDAVRCVQLMLQLWIQSDLYYRSKRTWDTIKEHALTALRTKTDTKIAGEKLNECGT